MSVDRIEWADGFVCHCCEQWTYSPPEKLVPDDLDPGEEVPLCTRCCWIDRMMVEFKAARRLLTQYKITVPSSAAIELEAFLERTKDLA